MTALSESSAAVSVSRSFPELARLIGPERVSAFWADYWEHQPLVVHRNDPLYYADLLTLDGIDEAVSLAGVDLHSIRVVVDGKETPVSDLGTHGGRNGKANSLEILFERYRAGSTIVVNSLQDRVLPLQDVAGALGGELGARIQMNVYLTPPGSRGFKPHYDTHDVFIAQVHGSKVWRLAGAPYELPLADRRYDKSQPEPDPLQEFELCAGDVLYLPRGTIHSGSTNETASLHVTIGIHPVLWAEAILDAVQGVFGTDVRFRRALPPGNLHGENRREQVEATFAELIEALREQLSPAAMAAETDMRINSISPPGLRHHLLDLAELPGIGPDTALRRRPGLRWQLSVDDSAARLSFHNKTVQFPAEVADEVRYVAEQTAPVTAGSIPGELDQPGRATLIHVLLSEGFLTVR